MEKFILSKPIEHNGEEIKELELNLEDLTAKQLMQADKEARAMLGKNANQNMTVPETNKMYLCCVAAKASNIGINVILDFKANDYTRLATQVQSFLLEDNTEEQTEEY